MSSLSRPTDQSNVTDSSEPAWIALVREKVEGLSYGVVQIVVHDGRVIQIERNEKTRLEGGARSPNAL